jgi:hypothetical protein
MAKGEVGQPPMRPGSAGIPPGRIFDFPAKLELLTISLLDRNKIGCYFWSMAARRRFCWSVRADLRKALTRQRTPNKACRSYYETANNRRFPKSEGIKNMALYNDSK